MKLDKTSKNKGIIKEKKKPKSQRSYDFKKKLDVATSYFFKLIIVLVSSFCVFVILNIFKLVDWSLISYGKSIVVYFILEEFEYFGLKRLSTIGIKRGRTQ